MKKKILSFILGSICTFVLIGCVNNNVNAVQKSNIEIIYKDRIDEALVVYKIKEKDTGNEYLVTYGYNSGGGITQVNYNK